MGIMFAVVECPNCKEEIKIDFREGKGGKIYFRGMLET